ncbi:MAG TPA: hypothetical protein VJ908_05185 [Wenzhouxiangellaceae bacterium]|nr:hypothetical protein [Wenzhouxiangellaceae bacterium]
MNTSFLANLRPVFLLATACALGACATGPREIRLEPPALQVENLRIEDGTVHFRLLVHNRNDHVLFLSRAAVAMRVDGTELFNAAWQLDLDMGPRGRELVRLDAPAMPSGAAILEAIERSGDDSVPFELASEIVIDGQRDAETVQQGFLHPVPGMAGEYR